MQTVQVAGEGLFEFPDDATDSEIRDALNRDYPTKTETGNSPAATTTLGVLGEEANHLFVGSLLRGVDNLQASLYGTGAAIAQVLGDEDARDWHMAGYLRNQKEAQANPSAVPSYTDVLAAPTSEVLGKAATYALEGVFENIPTMLPSMVGGFGASLIAGAGKKAVAEELRQRFGKFAAEKYLSGVAKKQIIGGGIAAYTANAVQEVGSITGDIYEKTGQVAPELSIPYGGVAALFDTASDLIGAAPFVSKAEKAILSKILGEGLAKEVSGRLITRVGIQAVKQMPVEGITEGIQTGIEKLAVSHADPTIPFWTSQNVDEIVDSILKGGLAGGAFGGIAGLRGKEAAPRDATTTAPPLPFQRDLTEADIPLAPGEGAVGTFIPEADVTATGEAAAAQATRDALELSKVAPLTAQAVLNGTPLSSAAPLTAEALNIPLAEGEGAVGTFTPPAKPPEQMTSEEAVAIGYKLPRGRGSDILPSMDMMVGDTPINTRASEEAGTLDHAIEVASAVRANKPVSAAAVDAYGIKLPEGWTKQGELMIPPTLEPSESTVGPTVEEIQTHLGDRAVTVVEAPGEAWDARSLFDPKTTKLLGIQINAANVKDLAQVDLAIDHELSHAVSESGDLDSVLGTLAPEELTEIDRILTELEYAPDQQDRESAARGIDALRTAWADRNWFQQVVGHVLRIANQAGFRLTRLGAEAIAARAVANARIALTTPATKPAKQMTPGKAESPKTLSQNASAPSPPVAAAPEYRSRDDVYMALDIANGRSKLSDLGEQSRLIVGPLSEQIKKLPPPYNLSGLTGFPASNGVRADYIRAALGLSIDADSIVFYGKELPEILSVYVREGDLYVHRPETTPAQKPAETVRESRIRRTETEISELAKDSEGFKNWYASFKAYLTDYLAEHADYAPLVSEFLSATSAATSVEVNVPLLVRALKDFVRTGEFPSFTLQSHAQNLARAGRGEQLSGPKISQYSAAVFGDESAIPVDRHIAQLFFNVDSPSALQIAASKRRIVRVAQRLGWTPRQVQAALWAANQKRKGQLALSYDSYLERHREQIHALLAEDRSGTGRGLAASRKIAERISQRASAARDASGVVARESRVPFYSKLTKVIATLPQETMTVQQARAAVEKGATKDEVAQQGILTDPLSPLFGADKPNYPDRAWVKSQLRNNIQSRVGSPVLDAFIIGSEARGAAKPGSDLDIGVVVPKRPGKTAMRVSEEYHAGFPDETFTPKWNGRKVDFQFFYADDHELAGYSKIPIEEKSSGKQPGDKVSKKDLLDYSTERAAKVEDVVLGGPTKEEWVVRDKYGSIAREGFASKDEASAAARSNSGEYADVKVPIPHALGEGTHFPQYQLPGADEGSYREMFVTWPENKSAAAAGKKNDNRIREITEEKRMVDALIDYDHPEKWTNEDRKNVVRSNELSSTMASLHNEQVLAESREQQKNWNDGHSSYSDIANPIVRIRRNIRTDANGKKVYFIEEIQGPNPENQAKMPDYLRKRIYEIGIKKALNDAVDEGADAIAWTTGDQQAERYDLSKSVDSVLVWESTEPGLFHYEAKKDGRVVIGERDRKGITRDKLDETLGKELGRKAVEDLANGKRAEYSGEGLKVGGEGLKALYDRTIPAIVNDLAKKFGGRVETGGIATRAYFVRQNGAEWSVIRKSDGTREGVPYRNKADAERWVAERGGKPEPVHSLTLPEAMKQHQATVGNTLFNARESRVLTPESANTGKVQPTTTLEAVRKANPDLLPNPENYHTQSEAKRADSAKAFVDSFNGNLFEATVVATDPKTYDNSTLAMQPIILGEIVKRNEAGPKQEALRDLVSEFLDRTGSKAGQNLQAYAQLRDMFDTDYQVRRARKQWIADTEQILKGVVKPEGVRKGVNEGKKRAKVGIKKVIDQAQKAVDRLLNIYAKVQKDTPELQPKPGKEDLIRKRFLQEVVAPTSPEQFTADLNALGASDEAGRVLHKIAATERRARDIVELVKNLEAATAQTPEQKSAKRLLNLYAKIQSDTPSLQSMATRDQVRERFLQQVVDPTSREQFISDLGSLTVDPVLSGKLFLMAATEAKSREAVQLAKDLARVNLREVSAQRILSAFAKIQSDTPSLGGNAVANPVRDRFAKQVSNPTDERSFVGDLAALGVAEFTAKKLFQVAATERRAQVLIQALKDATKVSPEQRSAERILATYAKIQSDTPSLQRSPTAPDPVKERFLLQVKSPTTETQFVSDLVALKTDALIAHKLFKVAATEARARDAYLRERTGASTNIGELFRFLGDREALGVDWGKIFSQHADSTAQSRQDLLARLRGVPVFANASPSTQASVVNTFGKLWEQHRNAEIQKVFARYAQAGGKDISKTLAKHVGSELPEIVSLANMGALDDESIWNALGPKFNLAAWTPEIAAEFKKRLEKEQSLPEGSTQRTRAKFNRLEWMAKQKGISNWSIAGEWWYAGVLSGIRTQLDNALSLVNVTTEVALTAAANPKMAPYMMSAYFRGWGIGLRLFGDIAKRGDYSHALRGEVEEKINKLKLLKDDPNVLKRAFAIGRFVPQFMSAMDTMNSAISQEARATQLAYSQAKEGTYPTQAEFDKAVKEILQVSPAQIKAATLQAQEEIDRGELTQKDFGRRRDEILETMRPSDIRDAAQAYGLITTGNSEAPSGLIGALYRGLITTRQLAPITIPVAPFLRFAANWTNILTDYLPPVGLARLAFNDFNQPRSIRVGRWFNKEFQPMSREDYQLLKAKVVLGSAVMMSGLAWAMLRGDDDEGFDIEGSWAGVTFDQQKILKAGGRIPYSIRIGKKYISYKNTSLVAVIGMIGSIRDAQKYTRASKKTQMGLWVTGMLRGAMVVKDMSMLAGLADVFGLAADKTVSTTEAGGTLRNVVVKSLGGFIPNIAKEVDAWFDPTVDKPMSLGEYFLKEIPVAHRLIGHPALNLLGEPVMLGKYPWSRLVSAKSDSPVWQELLRRADQGVFLPTPDEKGMLPTVQGKRVAMTPEQGYRYVKTVGEGYKTVLTSKLDNLKKMTPEQAQEYFDGPVFDRIRADAKKAAGF